MEALNKTNPICSKRKVITSDEQLINSSDFQIGELVVSKEKHNKFLYKIVSIHRNKIGGWDYLSLHNTKYKNGGIRGDYADKYKIATQEEIKDRQ